MRERESCSAYARSSRQQQQRARRIREERERERDEMRTRRFLSERLAALRLSTSPYFGKERRASSFLSSCPSLPFPFSSSFPSIHGGKREKKNPMLYTQGHREGLGKEEEEKQWQFVAVCAPCDSCKYANSSWMCMCVCMARGRKKEQDESLRRGRRRQSERDGKGTILLCTDARQDLFPFKSFFSTISRQFFFFFRGLLLALPYVYACMCVCPLSLCRLSDDARAFFAFSSSLLSAVLSYFGSLLFFSRTLIPPLILILLSSLSHSLNRVIS